MNGLVAYLLIGFLATATVKYLMDDKEGDLAPIGFIIFLFWPLLIIILPIAVLWWLVYKCLPSKRRF